MCYNDLAVNDNAMWLPVKCISTAVANDDATSSDHEWSISGVSKSENDSNSLQFHWLAVTQHSQVANHAGSAIFFCKTATHKLHVLQLTGL